MSTIIDHFENPKIKAGKEWMLKTARAIANDFASAGHYMFANNGGRYDELRLYGMNKQPIDIYKTLSEIDTAQDASPMNVDWTQRGPGPKYRTLGIDKVLAHTYQPVATPIDMQSHLDNQGLYARMKAKLMMRQAILQQDPNADITQYPALQMLPGEPNDLEELEMRMDFGEQFNRSKDQELLVQLAFYESKVMGVVRSNWARDAFDWGVRVSEDGIDENGRPYVGYVDPRRFIVSSCSYEDFRDMQYAGVLKDVDVHSLGAYFSEDELSDLKTLSFSAARNPFDSRGIQFPSLRNSISGIGKLLVLDFEVKTVDTLNWKIGKSKYGNPQIQKTENKKEASVSKKVQMVYAGKWIVGTDYIYDYGPAKFTKRQYSSPKLMGKTTLRFKARAHDFHEMTASSYMERLKPLQDDYMMVMLKAQNVRNNIVPNGYSFDLDALESVGLTWGGKNLDTKGIVSLFMKKGIIVHRGRNLSGMNPNGKAIEILQNSVANEIAGLYNELGYIVQQMRDVTGMNEITDGSTPSDRMLNGVASMANAATNTSLMPLVRSEQEFLSEIAGDIYIRVQQAVRNFGYEGFVPAINGNTMKFVQADATIAEKDCAIMMEMRPNDEQKQQLLLMMQEERAQGLLDLSDAITIMTTYNIKQAQMMLAYKVRKNRENKEQQALANQQMTIQGQQETVQIAEQAKQATIDREWEWRLKVEQEITARDLRLMEMKLGSAEKIKTADREVTKAGAHEPQYMRE